ncbi:hypothetical protein ACTFIV_000325 [Dictyostelium citrinum]
MVFRLLDFSNNTYEVNSSIEIKEFISECNFKDTTISNNKSIIQTRKPQLLSELSTKPNLDSYDQIIISLITIAEFQTLTDKSVIYFTKTMDQLTLDNFKSDTFEYIEINQKLLKLNSKCKHILITLDSKKENYLVSSVIGAARYFDEFQKLQLFTLDFDKESIIEYSNMTTIKIIVVMVVIIVIMKEFNHLTYIGRVPPEMVNHKTGDINEPEFGSDFPGVITRVAKNNCSEFKVGDQVYGTAYNTEMKIFNYSNIIKNNPQQNNLTVNYQVFLEENNQLEYNSNSGNQDNKRSVKSPIEFWRNEAKLDETIIASPIKSDIIIDNIIDKVILLSGSTGFSGVGIFLSQRLNDGIDFDEYQFGVPSLSTLNSLPGGYMQSRIIGEHLLLEASTRGIPAMTIRLPSIFSNPDTGIGHSNDFLQLLIKATSAIKYFPTGTSSILNIISLNGELQTEREIFEY